MAGDSAQGYWLLDTLRPFVYRRYRDFGAFEALREMKGMIHETVERRELHDNTNIGAGGIREVEFIGQAFQSIRGGAHPNCGHDDITQVSSTRPRAPQRIERLSLRIFGVTKIRSSALSF